MSTGAGGMEINQLVQVCAESSGAWFPETFYDQTGRALTHHVLALCGEAGELANIVKKIDRGTFDIDDANVRGMLKDELADVLIYVANVAAIIGMDLDQQVQNKMAFNETRFRKNRAHGRHS
jgi:NTP pyrophosphatase (non-canonical NTP hydrolase)